MGILGTFSHVSNCRLGSLLCEKINAVQPAERKISIIIFQTRSQQMSSPGLEAMTSDS